MTVAYFIVVKDCDSVNSRHYSTSVLYHHTTSGLTVLSSLLISAWLSPLPEKLITFFIFALLFQYVLLSVSFCSCIPNFSFNIVFASKPQILKIKVFYHFISLHADSRAELTLLFPMLNLTDVAWSYLVFQKITTVERWGERDFDWSIDWSKIHREPIRYWVAQSKWILWYGEQTVPANVRERRIPSRTFWQLSMGKFIISHFSALYFECWAVLELKFFWVAWVPSCSSLLIS